MNRPTPRILFLTLAAGLAAPFTAALLTPATALAQQPIRTAFPDDSVIAGDTLSRADELAEGGNPAEAIRVLQQLLLIEPEKVLPTQGDRSLFVPVRSVVHAFLLARPKLLQKYRLQEDPEAAALLAKGDLESLERSRFLTTSGLEAALRLAQRRFEAGHFEAARLTLDSVQSHPNFTGEPARAAAQLAATIAAYLPRPGTTEWAAALAKAASTPNAPAPTITWPEWLTRPARSPLLPSEPLPTSTIPSIPLTGDPFRGVEPDELGSRRPDLARSIARSWIFPTVYAESVIVNDGLTVRALDRATLVPLWQLQPDGSTPRNFADELAAAGTAIGREIEDAATVTIAEDIAVATTGVPISGSRAGDQRVHAMSATTGKPLWSVDPAWLDARLEEATVRGPAIIQDGTVILSLRKQANFRRLTSLYLTGLDLYTGRLLWVRHVGSIGSLPWGRTQPRPEASILHEGLIIRGDEMGVLTAVEAATGRPRWVRLLTSSRPFDQPYRGSEAPPPRDIVTPLIDGETIVYLEAEGGRIIRLNAADGAIIESRDASALASPRYLVKVGDSLAGVGVTRIAFVPLADFATATVRLSPPLPASGAIGRAIATGNTLTIPVSSGLAVIDPATPDAIRTIPLAQSGHVIVADDSASSSHLLTADGDRLYSYITWDAAEARLNASLKANPNDSTLLLSFLELANRAGRNDRLPDLANRAVTLATSPTANPKAQQLLFDLLLRLARAGTIRQTDTDSPLALRSLGTPSTTDAILTSLERCANTPRQLVDQLLELAAHRETSDRPLEAVDAFQRILEDSALAAVSLDGSSALRTAGPEARHRLESLLRTTGPGPYALFDAQAASQLAALPPNASAQSLVTIAERFPAAAVGTELWLRIATTATETGDTALASSSVGAALRAARLADSIGRPLESTLWAQLASAAFTHRTGREAAVYRFLRSLPNDPSFAITINNAPSDLASAATLLRNQLSAAPSRATIQPKLADTVHQLITGWTPRETIGNTPKGCPADQVFMISETSREFSLWAMQLEDGRLAPLWARPAPDAEPLPIFATADTSILFWPTAGGGTVECIDNLTGATRWKSADVAAALNPGEIASRRFPRLSTPLDGTVDATDLLIANDDSTLVLVQRTGKAIAFALESGALLWSAPVGPSRVFDTQICGAALLISGAGDPEKPGAENSHLTPILASVGLKSGTPLGTVPPAQLGDHVRWIRPLADGDAIVATAAGLLRIQPKTASIMWNIEGGPAAGSAAGWVAGGSIFVLDNESALWQFRTADGSRSADSLDTQAKIDYPLTAETVDDRLIIATSSGVLIYEQDGTLIGADSIHSVGRLMTPQIGRGGYVAVEAYADPAEIQSDDNLPGIRIRIHILDDASAKLSDTRRIALPDSPRGVSILNDRILIRIGRSTIILSTTN